MKKKIIFDATIRAISTRSSCGKRVIRQGRLASYTLKDIVGKKVKVIVKYEDPQ